MDGRVSGVKRFRSSPFKSLPPFKRQIMVQIQTPSTTTTIFVNNSYINSFVQVGILSGAASTYIP